jgi:hypothetical protein
VFLINVLVFDINGIEFVPLPNIDVLVGRDIICKGVFVMSFDGHATLSLYLLKRGDNTAIRHPMMDRRMRNA